MPKAKKLIKFPLAEVEREQNATLVALLEQALAKAKAGAYTTGILLLQRPGGAFDIGVQVTPETVPVAIGQLQAVSYDLIQVYKNSLTDEPPTPRGRP